MKLLIILAIHSTGIPVELKDFKEEAKVYYMPASSLVAAYEGGWGLKYKTCTIEFTSGRYVALGECSKILKESK